MVIIFKRKLERIILFTCTVAQLWDICLTSTRLNSGFILNTFIIFFCFSTQNLADLLYYTSTFKCSEGFWSTMSRNEYENSIFPLMMIIVPHYKTSQSFWIPFYLSISIHYHIKEHETNHEVSSGFLTEYSEVIHSRQQQRK